MPTELSIIIVNWNSRDYLEKCLESVFRSPPTAEFEVVVIDSGSFDGSKEMVEGEFPAVKFIQSEDNLGFVRANNLAAKSSTGRALLFLNPDTEVADGALSRLLEELEAHPDAGAIGARLLNTDGTLQTSCVQAFPSIVNQFLDAEILRRMFPKSALWGMKALFTGRDEPLPVEAVSGACLLMNRSLFEVLQGFSTDYFMYSEDIDLCRRAHDLERTNYYVPGARVVHHGGGCSTRQGVSTFSSVMVLESCWRYFRKMRSPSYAGWYRLSMLGQSLIRVSVLLVAWPTTLVHSHRSAWRNAFRKWYSRLRWSAGGEQWARRAKTGLTL